ncbi:MAG: putative hydro-lyase [Armatimonadota bacterium]|nr:putative hydro-lyase [Armatimonadota bacterium]MDR7426305.1 putative hydro-lyase [Armatimonadota bacterium]MDR7463268.1 putative hydro-lyase [Armatimonadota bacterium]MDR7470986.1 putative hydro-lyase [Armatimonadota bacterium]MDR7474724.1 putative hydro-lyase [Armatimonadota bacterium]
MRAGPGGTPETPAPAAVTPAQWRELIRRGEWTKPTAGLAPGYAQANLVVLPRAQAYDFLVFCQRNPKPCPLLEVTDAGDPRPRYTAQGADLRTDLPRYRIYQHGVLSDETGDLSDLWTEDLVAFLLGCSFTFEHAMMRAGIPVRHVEQGVNVPMYVTTIPCRPSGPFAGPMVVSMRPVAAHLVPRAVQVTSRYPLAHGGPLHIGDPEAIGIRDLHKPDFGDPVQIRAGEVPVFWACGVTPQAVALHARLGLLITHAPGHMFITDLPDEELALA